MKLFGKELFKKQKNKELYDFSQHGLIKNHGSNISDYISFSDGSILTSESNKKTKKAKIKEIRVEITPKGIYKLGSLNNNDFKIVSDDDYLAREITNCQKKLKLLPKIYRDNASSNLYAAQELESIIERLNNRKRLKEFTDILEEYPHSSSELINELLEKHNHLSFVKPHSFIPDLPIDAIEAMNRYNAMCRKLCNKDSVFYLIVNKKDTETRNARRDPILLAQSPFGFFWQILGAWDEEIIYLGDL